MKFSKQSFLFLAAGTASCFFQEALPVKAEENTWRPELPWEELESKLSSATSLVDTNPSDYIEECVPEFLEKPQEERTNYVLIDQPSGLCVNQMFCAFEGCYPHPNGSNVSLAERFDDLTGGTREETFPPEPYVLDWVMDTTNPSYNLPSKVLFPTDASEVIAAVDFARAHGLEVSVKNSGHSYQGASIKRDTLHVNMMQFPQYTTTSITDCNVSSLSTTGPTLSDFDDQPCQLAAARMKPAYIRVGGGENWDKTYRAVKAANEAQGESGYKYHSVGGNAGSVSPMGWTFQGGLAGTMGGRTYGFGVDQVLQIEMVLPNGQHVRFGPTEWETSEGYSVPRTTKVTGVCRMNPEERDEDKWIWSDCPDDSNIDFDDLWFAVNGGGGGTWGIITSLYLQLQDYQPLDLVQGYTTALLPFIPENLTSCPISPEMDELILDLTSDSVSYLRLYLFRKNIAVSVAVLM